jgi:hypothetical protein
VTVIPVDGNFLVCAHVSSFDHQEAARPSAGIRPDRPTLFVMEPPERSIPSTKSPVRSVPGVR